MPILYSIDINFNIAIPNFTGIVNISSTNNYTKVQNKTDGEGANNNGQGSTGNNSEDNNNKKDVGGVGI